MYVVNTFSKNLKYHHTQTKCVSASAKRDFSFCLYQQGTRRNKFRAHLMFPVEMVQKWPSKYNNTQYLPLFEEICCSVLCKKKKKKKRICITTLSLIEITQGKTACDLLDWSTEWFTLLLPVSEGWCRSWVSLSQMRLATQLCTHTQTQENTVRSCRGRCTNTEIIRGWFMQKTVTCNHNS